MKKFAISIGNTAFVNWGDEGWHKGSDINKALAEKCRFIWSGPADDVTDIIEHLSEYKDNHYYSFIMKDFEEKIIVKDRGEI